MLTFIDFFAEIGGFRRGMELAGHKCIGFCEFDKFAMASYTAMHCMTDEDRERLAALPGVWRRRGRRSTDMGNGTKMMLDGFSQRTYRGPTAGALDFPARTSALPESRQDSKETGAVFFSELSGLFRTSKKKTDPCTYSLKTLKICLVSTGDGISLPFSLRWTKAGTMQNGRLSILPDTSRRTGSAYSLLDILEDDVPAKYFLSREQTEKILFFK